MAGINLPLTNLVDGVSTRPMPERSAGSVASATNVLMRRVRGCEKRPGSFLLKAPASDYSLAVTNPTQPKHYHWINRDEDERFLMIVDPANTGTARIECFTVFQRGDGSGTLGNEAYGQKMGLTATNHTSGTNPLDYVALTATGGLNVRRRFRALTVADTTILCNKDVDVGLTGSAITYTDGSAANIRISTNDQNVQSWSDLPQPPTGTAGAGVTSSDYIFYTRDDDLGQPAGWYRASSTTQPPWYTRIRTEGANSLIDWSKWPIRVNFNGSAFVVIHPEWQDRFSGDSFNNPGPQLASGPSAPHKISDLCFFQSRLWFAGYELLDSSQTGDIFNLWNESLVGIKDTDPINISLQSDTVTIVDWMVPFDGGIVLLTRGSRQFEVKSQGAMTPSTVSLLPATNYAAVSYCAPAKLGNQLYFAAEQNQSMVLYEYVFQSDRSSNVATDITKEVEGFIPDDAIVIRTSNQNDMLFVLSSDDQKILYVCQMEWVDGRAAQRAWSKWTFSDPIQDLQVFDNALFLVFLRNNKLYIEAIDIGNPSNDTDGLTPTTVDGYSGSGAMEYASRLDSRGWYQGSYNAGTNTTTWTVPYEDASLDTVILGQMFDCNYEWPPSSGTFLEQRWKGKILKAPSINVSASGGSTTITASGNYATNANGDNARCWIGISYDSRIRLNEQFVRDQNGAAVAGKVHLKHLMVRLSNTGAFRVEITPKGRDVVTFEYNKDAVGQSLLGANGDFLEYDEFNMPCLGSAFDTRIEFVNDSPYPSRFIGGEFKAQFVREYDPTRR